MVFSCPSLHVAWYRPSRLLRSIPRRAMPRPQPPPVHEMVVALVRPNPPEPGRARGGAAPDASAPSSIAVTIGSNITLPWVFAQVTVDVDRGEVLLA